MEYIQLPFLQWLKRETSYGPSTIPPEWGEVILEKTKNSPDSGYFIEFSVQQSEGEEYRTCTLWPYNVWHESQTNLEKRRAWSQKQREERFIFEYNHKIVLKAVKKYFELDDNKASMVAMKYLRAPNNEGILKEMGINKEEDFARTIKDLP